MTVAYIGVGSNLGDRLGWIRYAVDALSRCRPGVEVLRVSPLYESAALVTIPVSGQEAGAGRIPLFLNLVVEVETTLAPHDLLCVLQRIEDRLGRRRPVRTATGQPAFQSRNIDLDLLFYGDLVVESAVLCIPHPRAHERSFVMFPMRDLQKRFVHPLSKRTIEELCQDPLEPKQIRRIN